MWKNVQRATVESPSADGTVPALHHFSHRQSLNQHHVGVCRRSGGGGSVRSLTHLPVSVADGLCEGAPSLSVFHLHRCIVGQQQVGTFCTTDGFIGYDSK